MRHFTQRWSRVVIAICALGLGSAIGSGRSQDQQPRHVIIPNPTPRQPDLEKEFGNAPNDHKAKLSVQNQLRAREIWLESNQILLLAQQLQQEVGKKSVSMKVNAAKAGQIEKLAQSVQQKMKVQ